MKHCLKIIAVLLLLSLSFSIVGCAAADKLADIVETKPFTVGAMEGTVYTNDFIGINCNVGEDWTVLSQEELAAQSGVISDLFNDENLKEMIDNSSSAIIFMANKNDGSGNINIVVGNTDSYTAALVDRDAMVDEIVAQLPESMAAASMEVISCGTENISFCGEEYYGIKSELSFYDLPIFQRQIIMVKGTYLVTITISSYNEDTTQSIIDLFTYIQE